MIRFYSFPVRTRAGLCVLCMLTALTAFAQSSSGTAASVKGDQGRSVSGADSAHGNSGGGKQRPNFSASGIEGTIAPSGYSSGMSEEDAAQVRNGVDDFSRGEAADIDGSELPAGDVQEPALLKAVRLSPGSFGANHALGVFLYRQGRFRESITYLEKARQIQGGDTSNNAALALALMGEKHDSQAISLLQQITRDGKVAPLFIRLLGRAYAASGDVQRATTSYVRAALVDPDDANIFLCGTGLLQLGNGDAAERVFSNGVGLHPHSAKLWTGLGIAQDLQQKKVEAVQSLLHAVDLDSEYPLPYDFLAELAGSAKDANSEIQKRLGSYLAAHPESGPAHYDYALALWRENGRHPEEASLAEVERQLHLAVIKDPGLARAHFQLGIVYAASGNYRDSAAELKKALQLKPGDAEAHYRLAMAYRQLHERQLAVDEMKQFLQLRDCDQRDGGGTDALLEKLSSTDAPSGKRAGVPCSRR